MFVGRTRSLALLADDRAQARAGVPARVLVEGSAGIGKTALVRHFLSGCGQEPGTVPWADILSDAWSALGEESAPP